ncbi:DUF2523 family protein [Photobacterium sp. DNB23_23_1]|uniref:DUF2523 domain-containing protein n=1 Tax=Photobacterium pectinilyticum TaxID=2906793 RepID=A0ABT1MWS4_9GAMM|nr:DUF2523 family protein [Photobacterium sp. ZSDE20]MCQ1056923.1 DUF2523 domain-containing protein [Photobacterium sp. ZSDE20]MDD1821058.1 DUF2523 domain-containing protein [Photobacterium sp. ZSDE20]
MFDWIVDLFNILLDFLYKLVLSLVDMLIDSVYFILEQLLVVGKGLISLISDMLAPVDLSEYMTGFPPSVSWVLGQIGLPQALGIIITAITIRLILQLIPFVRLGS